MSDLTLADLDRLYRAPHPLVLKKSLDHIDRYARMFITRSPFCLVSSAGPDGTMDVSPRGGTPGFIHIADDKTLLMPDRGGNNRLDTLRNLLSGDGRIGLLFVIPGIDDVLRVNGRAGVTADPTVLAGFEEFGKLPKTVVRIAVEEAFLHCPKAMMRASLWDASTWTDRADLPSIAEMVSDQLGLPPPTASKAEILEGYKAQL